MIDLERLLIDKETKDKVKNASAKALPIDSTIKGWSATRIRNHLAKQDEVVIGVVEERMEVVKDVLEKVVGDAGKLTIYSEDDPQDEENSLKDGSIWRKVVEL